jgi:hypothetical protein
MSRLEIRLCKYLLKHYAPASPEFIDTMSIVQNAKNIMLRMEISESQYNIVIVIAYVYRIYTRNLTKEIQNFIHDLVDNNNLLTNNIIECMYSRLKQSPFVVVVGDVAEWTLINNIASDAILLESIGSSHIQQKTREFSNQNANFTSKMLLDYILIDIKHTLSIYPNKLYTNNGCLLASGLHDYTLNWLLIQGVNPKELEPYVIKSPSRLY